VEETTNVPLPEVFEGYLRHANTKTAKTAKTGDKRRQTRKRNRQKLANLSPHIARREKFDDKELGLQKLTARSLLGSLDEVEKHRDHKPLSYSNQECA
jgi:hypothetical protein